MTSKHLHINRSLHDIVTKCLVCLIEVVLLGMAYVYNVWYPSSGREVMIKTVSSMRPMLRVTCSCAASKILIPKARPFGHWYRRMARGNALSSGSVIRQVCCLGLTRDSLFGNSREKRDSLLKPKFSRVKISSEMCFLRVSQTEIS
jgi:hypothetical protein